MIQRILAASVVTGFLLLPTVGCNQKEKAVLPSTSIPLPEHGPTAAGTGGPAPKDKKPADPVKDAPKPADPAKDAPKPAEAPKDKAPDPVKKDAPK